MSTIDRTIDLLGTGSEWLNPIVVKEVRQSLKSKIFVTTFMLTLLACWAISVFGIMISWNYIEYSPVSLTFFIAYYWVLAFALFVVIPFGAFGSLQTERDQNTFEILQITTLTPSQIVTGKLWSAFLQACILYAVIAPFIAFSSLLQGFDVLRVGYQMGLSLVICMGASMACLMLSTMGKQRNFKTLMILFLLGGLVSLFFSQVGYASAMMLGGVEIDREFIVVNLALLLAGITYFFLFHQITVSQLTFESDNRSFGVRVIMTIQFYLMWAWVYGYYTFYTSSFASDYDEVMNLVVTISVVHWSLLGFFAMSEPETLSRRIRRDLPKSFLGRWLMAGFVPGGSRGFFLVSKHLLVTFLLAYLLPVYVGLFEKRTLAFNSNLIDQADFEFLWPQLGYALLYLGIGRLLSSMMVKASPNTRPAHGRVVLLIVVVLCVIVPYLLLWASGYYDNNYTWDYHPLLVLNPFESLSHIASSGEFQSLIVTFALTAGGVSLLLNVPAMVLGIKEVLWPDRPPKSHPLEYAEVLHQLEVAEQTGTTAAMS